MAIHNLSTMSYHSDFIHFYYTFADFELIPTPSLAPSFNF